MIHILDNEIYFDDNEIKLCDVTDRSSCLFICLQKNLQNSLSDTN